MNAKRVRMIKEGTVRPGPVVYWMSRDQRASDNWALLHAQAMALERKVPLIVAFCLVRNFLGAGKRAYAFMLRGLGDVQRRLATKGISFKLLQGNPGRQVPAFVKRVRAGVLVTDFDPLRIKREWKAAVAAGIDIPFLEVDAHNIVPCWIASPKQEFGAYTFRPKIHRLIPEFLEDFPPLRKHPFPGPSSPVPDWDRVLTRLAIESDPAPVDWLAPGENPARQMLKHFLEHKLAGYEEVRNDPTLDGQSNLSPYLHFGQIAAQRAALEVTRFSLPLADKEAFLEELIVRRELADNFCFNNAHYDSIEGFPAWARATLHAHARDKRPARFRLEELAEARTYDDLWNASQVQLLRTGKMHGYMRMYWGKKILEWTRSPAEALKVAIHLNDRYELDGRDPNGYTGIAWCLGGVHDRPWPERPIFGKIRYMSYNGCKAKFDIGAYIRRFRDA